MAVAGPWPDGRGRMAVAVAVARWPWPWPDGRGCGLVDGAVAGWPWPWPGGRGRGEWPDGRGRVAGHVCVWLPAGRGWPDGRAVAGWPGHGAMDSTYKLLRNRESGLVWDTVIPNSNFFAERASRKEAGVNSSTLSHIFGLLASKITAFIVTIERKGSSRAGVTAIGMKNWYASFV